MHLSAAFASHCDKSTPITQPWVHNIHTTVQHSSYMLGLHCVVWFPTPKKICPFHWRIPSPPLKKLSTCPPDPQWHNRHTYTELLQLFLYDKLVQTAVQLCLHCVVPSVLWRCWLGVRKGIRPVKKTEWWDVGVVVCMGCRLAYSPADATATHYLLLQ